MDNLTDFIINTIGSSVVGNASYDFLKTVLGTHFLKTRSIIIDKNLTRQELNSEIENILNNNPQLKTEINNFLSHLTQNHAGSGHNINIKFIQGDFIVN